MKRIISIAILCAVLLNPVMLHAQKLGQAAIDSMLSNLREAKEDTNQVILLDHLCYEYSNTDPSEGLRYGTQALALATKLGWEKGIADANRYLAVNHLNKTEYSEAMARNQAAMAIYQQTGDKKGVAATLINIGMVYLNQTNYNEATNWLQQALKIANVTGDKETIALAIADLAIVYNSQSDFPKALEYSIQALKLYEETGNKFLIASVTQNIGVNYHAQGNYAKANEFFTKALELGKETGNKSIVAHALLNLGANFGDQHNTEQAISCETQALKMFEEMGDKRSIATITGNLGANYLRQKKYLPAITFQKKALRISIEIGNKLVQAYNLYNISNTFLSFVVDTPSRLRAANDAEINKAEFQTKEVIPTGVPALLRNATEYASEALAVALELHAMDLAEGCYQNLSDAAMLGGDYKKALEYSDTCHDIKDSIFSKANSDKIAQLAADYELDKKQTRISLLEKDKQLNTETIRRQVWQRNTIGLISVLLLILIAAFFLVRSQRNKKIMQVAFSRSLLQNQEQERQRISRELHDSIGQNILFIKNQLSGQKESGSLAPVMETIDMTIDEVRNISKDLYPNQLEKYGLSAAVEALAEKVNAATGIFVSADMHEIEGVLWKEASINLYRIIQEALNNTIKHAGAKAVRITGNKINNRIALAIMDNGKGFDAAVRERKAQGSSGLLNMEERAKMLGGKMELETAVAGTKITITIPIRHEV